MTFKQFASSQNTPKADSDNKDKDAPEKNAPQPANEPEKKTVEVSPPPKA